MDDATPKSFARPAGNGTVIQGPAGGLLTFKARGADTAGALTVLENVIAPGDGPPLHVHDRKEESLHVVDGSVRCRLGDQVAELQTGGFAFVPRGVPHCMQNVGRTPATLLIVYTPAGVERFFEELATRGLGVASEAFAEVAERHGMHVVGPPLTVSHPLEAPAARAPIHDEPLYDPVRFGV